MKINKKSEPRIVSVEGHELRYPVCNNEFLLTRGTQLNTSVATFFNLDRAKRSANCFVCSEYIHISWLLG